MTFTYYIDVSPLNHSHNPPHISVSRPVSVPQYGTVRYRVLITVPDPAQPVTDAIVECTEDR